VIPKRIVPISFTAQCAARRLMQQRRVVCFRQVRHIAILSCVSASVHSLHSLRLAATGLQFTPNFISCGIIIHRSTPPYLPQTRRVFIHVLKSHMRSHLYFCHITSAALLQTRSIGTKLECRRSSTLGSNHRRRGSLFTVYFCVSSINHQVVKYP